MTDILKEEFYDIKFHENPFCGSSFVFCVYKRTEDGGQSDNNSCSAAKTSDATAKTQMQREKENQVSINTRTSK